VFTYGLFCEGDAGTGSQEVVVKKPKSVKGLCGDPSTEVKSQKLDYRGCTHYMGRGEKNY